MGEIAIAAPGSYELCHAADFGRAGLEVHGRPEAAREIARFDAAGKYRPLKTAPDLRRGWKLALPDVGALREALDYFYPAMLATRLAWEEGRLRITPLRETLGRQSGMYAVTKRIGDIPAQEMIGGFCASRGGCLKTILWPLAPGLPVTSLPPEKFDATANQDGSNEPCIPLLCVEACNLLVARAREVVKRSPGAT